MRFNVTPHSIRMDVEIVEVFDDQGRFIGQVVLAEDGQSIKVISKYATGEVIEDPRGPHYATDGRRVRSLIVCLRVD